MVTSNLLIQGADPRKVVGTVNSVEFFLTLTVSATFIWHLGIADVAGATLGLLIGGVIAAPISAWAAKHFNPKTMLILVGVVLNPDQRLRGVEGLGLTRPGNRDCRRDSPVSEVSGDSRCRQHGERPARRARLPSIGAICAGFSMPSIGPIVAL